MERKHAIPDFIDTETPVPSKGDRDRILNRETTRIAEHLLRVGIFEINVQAPKPKVHWLQVVATILAAI